MATATALISNGRIESARRLDLELRRCETAVAEVKASILARAEPNVVRWQFRQAQSAMMCLGQSLSLDNRFKPRLPREKRNKALEMLRAGARPIVVQRQLGIDSFTIRRLRHRELNDNRNLNRVCKLNADQIAEIRSTGRATTRRTLAEQFNVSMSLISKIRNGRGPYRREAAVPVSSVQVSPVKRPGPAKTNELSLCLNAELARSLAEMAELAHSELAPFVMELVEVQVANFRAKPVPTDFLKPDNTPPPMTAACDTTPRQKLSPEDRARMAEQRDGGMTIPEIARRWNIAETTIRRALGRARKKRALPAPEVVQKILFLNGQKYDDADEFIGVQAISKAVGQSEGTVRSVLAAHKPLTPSSGVFAHKPRPGGWKYAS